MFSLVFITVLNTLIAFAHELSKPVKTLLNYGDQKKRQVAKEKLRLLEEEVQKIDPYANFAEWAKKQREVDAHIQKEDMSPFSAHSLKTEAINFSLGYIFQFVGSLILLFISIYYRYTPVIVFDERFNFAPFGKMIGFPTGVDNAISVPFWIFVTNFTCRCVANLFRT